MMHWKNLLRAYYHLDNNHKTSSAVIQDIWVTLFGSGSGLFASILRGIVSKLYVKSQGIILIGKNFRIIKPNMMTFGSYMWIWNNVTLFAIGKITVGRQCIFRDGVSIWSGRKGITIGNNVAIAHHSYLYGTGGKIILGNDVMVSDHVCIYTMSHDPEDLRKPQKVRRMTTGDVTIGNDVVINSGACIKEGIKIGQGSMIGAGAMVTKDVPPHVIVVGVPAKVLRRI